MRRTWVAVAVICAGMVPAPTSAHEAPPPASAGGEHWYGYVSMEGMGSHKLPDGGQFTNHDKYVLNAPEPTDDAKDPEPGKLNITIDTTLTRPDPFPDTDGCWTRVERGMVRRRRRRRRRSRCRATSPATTLLDNVDAYDSRSRSPTTSTTAARSAAQPCSDGDTSAFESYTTVGRHPLRPVRQAVCLRNGAQRDRACGRAEPGRAPLASECTDYLYLQLHPARSGRNGRSPPVSALATRVLPTWRPGHVVRVQPCQTKSLSSRVTSCKRSAGSRRSATTPLWGG